MGPRQPKVLLFYFSIFFCRQNTVTRLRLHLIQQPRSVLIRMFCWEEETQLLSAPSYQQEANLWLKFISNLMLYASIKVRNNAGKAPVEAIKIH